MRHHRFFTILFAACVAACFQTSAFADLSATDAQAQFNSLNSNRGYLFEALTNNTYFGQFSGEVRLESAPGMEIPNLNAYNGATSGSNYFQTFCVAPTQSFYADEINAGMLNYNGTQTTTSTGTALNLGVAYLYKEFAAGNLDHYNYQYGNSTRVPTAVLLQDAIWFLLGETASMTNAGTNWTNNTFLQLLLGLNASESYWKAVYDPGGTYDIMGDAMVFVVRTSFSSMARSPALIRQDVLYVVNGGGGGDVPEPASLLLWTLGSVSAAGVAYRKRRKAAK